MVGFLFFGGSIAAIGQIQQRANHPYRADRTKNVQSPCGYNGPKPANEGYGQEGVEAKAILLSKTKVAPTECKRPAVRRALVAKWCAVRESNPRPWD